MVADKSIPPFSLRASLIKDGVSLSLIRISKELNGAKRRGRERRRANSRAARGKQEEKQQVGGKKRKKKINNTEQ